MSTFVGRRRELEILADAGAQGGAHVVVSGAAGMGKSRLLDELQRVLDGRGTDVERIYASDPDSAVPFAPFAHLLGDGLPSIGPTDLMARLLAALSARCHDRHVCVVIDDAHLLDPTSVELLHQAMSRLPLTAVLAARPDPGLDRRLRSAARSRDVIEIQLELLTATECTELLQEELRGTIDDDVCREVVRLSGGNPFLLVELLAAGINTGALAVDPSGTWRLHRHLAVPPSIQDVIAERLGQLDSQAIDLLHVLAVTGGLPLAGAMTLVHLHELTRLEEIGLVVIEQRSSGATVVLEHDLYREALLAGAASRQLRAREQAIAALDACRGGDEALDLLAARLSLELGRSDAARHLHAAVVALRAWDAPLAISLAAAAESAGAGPRAALVRASALGALGRRSAADELFEALGATSDVELLGEVIAEHASYLLVTRDDPVGALALLSEGLERCGPEHDEPVRANLAAILFYAGRIDEAVAAAEPLLDKDRRFPGSAAHALLGGWAVMGRPADVLRLAAVVWDQLVDDRADQNFPLGLNLLFCRLLALVQVGRSVEGDEPFHSVGSATHGAWERSWVVRDALPATQSFLRGHLESAAATYDRIRKLFRSIPSQIWVINEAILATVHAQQGRPAAARPLLADIATVPPDATALYQWWIDRAGVWLAASEGAVASAVELSLALVERNPGKHFYATVSLHDVVRLGHPELAVDALGAAAERPGATWLDKVCADHAVAASTSNVAGLLQVAERLEAGGLDLLALEAAAQASVVALSAGRLALHSTAVSTVERLSPRCGHVITPAAQLERSVLTDREFEVARLAEQGLTNAQIGARLGTSTRTVGNQLQRVYEKLGIHCRQELRGTV